MGQCSAQPEPGRLSPGLALRIQNQPQLTSPPKARARRVWKHRAGGETQAGDPCRCAGFTLGDGDVTTFIAVSLEKVVTTCNFIVKYFLRASFL